MRHTVRVIDEQIKEQGIPARLMAIRMGMEPRMFARFRDGMSRGVLPDTLISMQEAISDDPMVRATLLAAYLQDQCIGPAANMIKITIMGQEDAPRVKERDPSDSFDRIATVARDAALDEKLVGALIFIVARLKKNPGLRKLLLSFCSFLRQKQF